MPSLQDWIHQLEEGSGVRYLKIAAACLALLAMALLYDLRAYRGFSAPAAMDAAQLARNIVQGQGYTTLCLRPFSLYLVQRHNQARLAGTTNANANADLARIRTGHPDLANPPVWPLTLAAMMKVLPFDYTVKTSGSFWSDGTHFLRYEPEFLIAVFNQILLLVVAALTFLLARRIFDSAVAWLSAILVLGCELLWRFSASGLPKLLLMLIFLGLAWCLLRIEELARDPEARTGRLFAWVIVAGALTGVGALTRYAFGWLILPVLAFLILFGGPRRVALALTAAGTFAVLLVPWVIRNYAVSGTPFGTAGFAMIEGTPLFPGFKLERSLHPDLSLAFSFGFYIQKFLVNVRAVLADGLPKLGGSWASVLFLAGLLLGFRSLPARRIRYFLLMCLGVFIVIQPLGETGLSAESPVVNSENLLVLLAPLVFIYGAGFFFTLLDQMQLGMMQLRYAVIGVFAALCCLPMLFALLLRTSPVAYPPYFPPDVQMVSGWMNQNELMMSDVPWAVAWYGQRQCVWLTLNAQDEFFAINDYLKPVSGLYLTPETLDDKFLTRMARAPETSWGHFILQMGLMSRYPKGFPLRQTRVLLSGLFLTDRPRWNTTDQKEP